MNKDNTMAYTVVKHSARMTRALISDFIHSHKPESDEWLVSITEYVANKIKVSLDRSISCGDEALLPYKATMGTLRHGANVIIVSSERPQYREWLDDSSPSRADSHAENSRRDNSATVRDSAPKKSFYNRAHYGEFALVF